jgi:hypothetical protein
MGITFGINCMELLAVGDQFEVLKPFKSKWNNNVISRGIYTITRHLTTTAPSDLYKIFSGTKDQYVLYLMANSNLMDSKFYGRKIHYEYAAHIENFIKHQFIKIIY